jgi:hypothetical protein
VIRSATARAVVALALIAALGGPARAEGSVELYVDPAIAATDREAVRTAVERDIGRPVKLVDRAPAGEGITVTKGPAGSAVVAYRSGDRVTERALDLPEDPAQRAQAIALLSGNVVRDEAAELLRQLQKDAVPPAPAPPAPPAAEAPKPPAPKPAASKADPEKATTTSDEAKGEPPPKPAPFECVDPAEADVVGGDFVPFVGLSSVRGLEGTRVVSFNMIGGITRGISGAEVGGMFNITAGPVCGAQVAGIFDVAVGSVRGDQLGGLAAVALGRVEGGQLGGLATWSGQGVRGLQLAGLANHAGDHVEGVQLAGLVNHAGGRTSGLQFAGLVNVARDVKGVQFAGIASVAKGDVEGVQVGSVNVATGHARVQAGLLNVAESVDVPLGLVSIMKKGETQGFASVSSWGLVAAGLRHGNGFIHNVYGIGALPFASRARGAVVFGIGLTPASSDRVSLDVDAMLHGVHSFRSYAPAMVAELKVPIRVKVGERVSLWGAPGYSVALGDAVDEVDLNSFAVTIFETGPDKLVRGFPSATAGVMLEL